VPLIDISSQQALANRRTNPQGSWGDRSSVNRVEPICKPAFDVPFRLEPGNSIFTIGSCFARNVEQALAERGFRIPMQVVFRCPEFAKADRGVVNNYATPCIYNEIAWAFGEEHFDEANLIAEIVPGKFVDLNIAPTLRPETREIVDSRRRAIAEAYRSSASCRVIIITLGLSEVWFDTVSGTYINVSPRPGMVRAEPDRFRLHVLSFDETYDFLAMAVSLLSRHGRSDQQIIVNVSPVPLGATHRNQDVIVANMYSKSVLRVAAEALVAGNPRTTYFPSYESFALSDRKLAFIDDLVHTQTSLVSINVGRMVDAYTGSDDTLESLRDAIAMGGEVVAAHKAACVPAGLAEGFFAEHGSWSDTSAEFAKSHARFLLKQNRPAEALAILALHDGSGDLELRTLAIEAAIADNRPELALLQVGQLPPGKVKAVRVWDQMLTAAIKHGDPDTVLAILTRLMASVRSCTPGACFRAARFFRDRGDVPKAAQLYQIAHDAGSTNLIAFEYAEALLGSGRPLEARTVLASLTANTPSEEQRLGRLKLIA
jgi:hypothetical protein